jgi:hypothetical protein
MGFGWLLDPEATGVTAGGASLVSAVLVFDQVTSSMQSSPAQDDSTDGLTRLRRQPSCHLIHLRRCTPSRIVRT